MDLQDITKKIEKMYQQSQEEEKLVKIWKKETIWMLVEYIITHLDEYLSPAYVRYMKSGNFLSPANPSEMTPYISNVKRGKLSKQKDHTEYGFNDKNQILYSGIRDEQGKLNILNYYVTMNEITYCLGDWYIKSYLSSDFIQKWSHEIEEYNLKNIDIYEIYRKDEKNRPLFIFNFVLGGIHIEIYQWIHDNLAFITNKFDQWILIKDGKNVLGCFCLWRQKQPNYLYCYNTKSWIDLNNYQTTKRKTIKHSSMNITYANILNEDMNSTECFEVNIDNDIYFCHLIYLKNQTPWSYQEAKAVYQNEILNYLHQIIKQLDFDVKTIMIEYVAYGCKMLNPLIGFDTLKKEQVEDMQYYQQYQFPLKDEEIMDFLGEYVVRKQYYNSTTKMMKNIKKEIEKQYDILVILKEKE